MLQPAVESIFIKPGLQADPSYKTPSNPGGALKVPHSILYQNSSSAADLQYHRLGSGADTRVPSCWSCSVKAVVQLCHAGPTLAGSTLLMHLTLHAASAFVISISLRLLGLVAGAGDRYRQPGKRDQFMSGTVQDLPPFSCVVLQVPTSTWNPVYCTAGKQGLKATSIPSAVCRNLALKHDPDRDWQIPRRTTHGCVHHPGPKLPSHTPLVKPSKSLVPASDL